MTRRVLLVSNVPLDGRTGRGANFAARTEMLADEGWETVVGLVEPPYLRSFLPALVRCVRLARRSDVDVVTSVSNPFHLQLVGLVAALLAGKPWVAEFRDPMVENPDRDPSAPTTYLARVVEWLVVYHADLVVWGDGIQMPEDYFETTYNVDPDRIRKLPYKGFRPSVFEAAETATFDKFTITYAGSFYDDWIEPYTVFRALATYVDAHADADDPADVDLRMQFYGDWRAEYDEAIEGAGVGPLVEHHEFVPKSELLPVLKGSDALLYLGGDKPANQLNVPSKVYDYIGAKRPMLAVLGEDFRVADLVREGGLGIVAPYDDPAAIADAIATLREDDPFDPDPSVYDRFDRRRKVEALAAAYDDARAGRV